MPVDVVFRPSVFSSDGVRHGSVNAGTRVQDALAGFSSHLSHLLVLLDGALVGEDRFCDELVEGQHLLAIGVPAGGAEDRKMVLRQAALLSAVAFSGGVLAPAAGLTGIGAGALNLGTLFATQALLDKFIPLPTARDKQQPVYTVSGSSNDMDTFGPVQRVYGRHRIFPKHASAPYSRLVGEDQYLFALLDCGFGPLSLSNFEIGGIPVEEFAGVELKVHESYESGDPLFLYGDTPVAVQQPNAVLAMPEKSATDLQWQTLETSTDCSGFEVDLLFPGGLYRTSKSDVESAYVEVFINVRETENLTAEFVDPWAWFDVKGAIQPAGRQIDAYDPLTETDLDGVTYRVRFSGKIRHAFMQTLMFSNPDGSALSGGYTIRLAKRGEFYTDEDDGDKASKYVVASTVTSVKTIKTGATTNFPSAHTVIELRAKATDQVNGALDAFSAIATSKLRSYETGTGFVAAAATRNPAWIFADILTGTVNPRPLADAEVDWPTLEAWAAKCDAEVEVEYDGETPYNEARYVCDFVFDEDSTVLDLLRRVAAVGRATPSLRDGLYSVAFEDATATAVQVFTPRNSSGFSASREFVDLPHAFRVTFTDAESDYQQRQLDVYRDGYDEGSAIDYQTLSLFGVTRASQAYRDGRYYLAELDLRSERFTLRTDVENLVCQRGDVVRVAYDVPLAGGTSCRVTGASTVSTYRQLTVDEPITAVSDGDTVYLTIRTIVSGELEVYSITGTAFGTPVNAIRVSLTTHSWASNISVGDMIVMRAATSETEEFLVDAVAAEADFGATLTLVPRASELDGIELGETMTPYSPSLSELSPAYGAPPPVTGLSIEQWYEVDGGAPVLVLDARWTGEAARTSYEVYLKEIDPDDANTATVFLGTADGSHLRYRSPLPVVGSSTVVGKVFRARVIGVNAFGQKTPFSEAATVDFTVTATSFTVPAPENFVVDVSGSKLAFRWDAVPTVAIPDIDYYELRHRPEVSSSNLAASLLIQRVSGSGNMAEVPYREGTWFLRAVSISGDKGEAARVVIDAQSLADVLHLSDGDVNEDGELLVGSVEAGGLWQGTHYNTEMIPISNYGLVFDGIGDYCRTSGGAGVAATTAVCVSARAVFGESSGNGTILLWGTAGVSHVWLYTPTTSTVKVGVYNSSSGTSVAKEVSISHGIHDVLATWDGTYVRIYIDGVLAGTSTGGTGGSVGLLTTHNLFVGSVSGVHSFYLGTVAQVRLANSIPTDTQIADAAGSMDYQGWEDRYWPLEVGSSGGYVEDEVANAKLYLGASAAAEAADPDEFPITIGSTGVVLKTFSQQDDGFSRGTFTLRDPIELDSVARVRPLLDLDFTVLDRGAAMSEWASLDDVDTLAPSFDVDDWDVSVEIAPSESVISNVMSDWLSLTSVVSLAVGSGVADGAWRPIGDELVKGRSFFIRANLASRLEDVTPVLRALSLYFYIRPKVYSATDVALSASGWTTITYPEPFYSRPALSVAVQELGTGEYYRFRNNTKTGVDVAVFNSGGSMVARSIDILAQGFGG